MLNGERIVIDYIMKKLVVIINGNGGVGKDTLCDFAQEAFTVRNISAITPIKEIASAHGWNGEKDAKARKLLADLKAAFVAYNDLPFLYIKEEYKAFLEDEKENILFIHIREASEIDKVKAYIKIPCVTLLITRKQKKNQCWGNPSDDNVSCYTYDYQYNNDKNLKEAKQDFIIFLQRIFAERI
jgi:hypothetical protein